MEENFSREREEILSHEEGVVVRPDEKTMSLHRTWMKALAMKKKNINQYLKENKNQKN